MIVILPLKNFSYCVEHIAEPLSGCVLLPASEILNSNLILPIWKKEIEKTADQEVCRFLLFLTNETTEQIILKAWDF